MKISAKGRYGIESILFLSINCIKGEAKPLYQIASQLNIPLRYLEQVFSLLKKGGLVVSVQGNQGGYKLSRPSNQISIGDVLSVLEGPMQVVKTKDEKDDEPVRACLDKHVYQEIEKAILKKYKEITIDKLVVQYQNENGYDGFDFQI